MAYKFINIAIHLLAFACSFYGLSCIRFEKFTNVTQPAKVNFLLLVLAMGLAGLVADFLMAFINF